MDYRTSITDLLRIADLPVSRGHIGLTICPGKQGESNFGAPWKRDLETDIAVIKAWGADAVISLVEDKELIELGVPQLGEAFREGGMIWHHLPIQDLYAPSPETMNAWRAINPSLHQTLDRSGKILVHCRGRAWTCWYDCSLASRRTWRTRPISNFRNSLGSPKCGRNCSTDDLVGKSRQSG